LIQSSTTTRGASDGVMAQIWRDNRMFRPDERPSAQKHSTLCQTRWHNARISDPAVMTAASGALEMAPPGHGISFDLSRSHAEDLLTGFHAGTRGVDLGTRLTDLGDLPHQKLRLARNAGRPWTAWPTPSEPIAACEDYDLLAPAWA
jgi:hypothetical protein